ncbi:MAG: DUF4340 domain-containing protein [Deltaproteobacteria bacterium]|nr:DUF4340 domain-containing protein [Deltaproteobacteria bacterium]
MKKRLLSLLLSLCFLGGVYYTLFYDTRYILPKGFLSIDPSEISSLVIYFKDQPYGFDKEDINWKLSSPYVKNIDQWSIENFLRNLCMIPVTRKISENVEGAEKFGLKRPEVRINLTYGSEKKNMSVMLGNDNESKTSTYAKRGGIAEIVLLGKVIKEDVINIIKRVDI